LLLTPDPFFEVFKNFDQDHAITLFYEPFLQAFDPHLRKELGVWHTPPEIVKYMVGRVDQLLRSELGIADGLADDNVYILDPAAGTGSYVVEVARRIHQTLTEQGHGALAAAKTKKALTTRVFGFEILPAPYVVAHLQLGVLLRELPRAQSPRPPAQDRRALLHHPGRQKAQGAPAHEPRPRRQLQSLRRGKTDPSQALTRCAPKEASTARTKYQTKYKLFPCEPSPAMLNSQRRKLFENQNVFDPNRTAKAASGSLAGHSRVNCGSFPGQKWVKTGPL
jgi:hypothetical protein